MSSVLLDVMSLSMNGVSPMTIGQAGWTRPKGIRGEREELLMMVYALLLRYKQIDLSQKLRMSGTTNFYRWLQGRNKITSRAMRENILHEYLGEYGDVPPETVIPAKVVAAIRSQEPIDAPRPLED